MMGMCLTLDLRTCPAFLESIILQQAPAPLELAGIVIGLIQVVLTKSKDDDDDDKGIPTFPLGQNCLGGTTLCFQSQSNIWLVTFTARWVASPSNARSQYGRANSLLNHNAP